MSEELRCENCGQVVPSDLNGHHIFYGEYGCAYVECTACGTKVWLEKDGLDLNSNNIEYPEHFGSYGKGKPVSNEEIQQKIRVMVADMEESTEKSDWTCWASGDTRIDVFKYGDGEIEVIVAKNYQECSFYINGSEGLSDALKFCEREGELS